MTTPQELAERVVSGDLRAAARAMRLVDDRAPAYMDVMRALYPHTGRASIIGLTGTPGAGKSTTVDRLIVHYRAAGKRVGIVAVDPSSPFTGGAILGDRIRMQRHFLDEGVFIRSLATRGHLGGLSRSASDVIHVLDAHGCDVVLVETVGVGQDELDIARLAQTTIVIMAPGLGDDIQAIKAGILEIADVFIVNKADRDGADSTVRDLEQMIALGEETGAARKGHGHSPASMRLGAARDEDRWRPPVLKVIATKGEGIEALAKACADHQAHLLTSAEGADKTRVRLRLEVLNLVRESFAERSEKLLAGHFDTYIDALLARRTDPYDVSAELVQKALRTSA